MYRDDFDIVFEIMIVFFVISFLLLFCFFGIPNMKHKEFHVGTEYIETNYIQDCYEIPIYAFADSSQLNGEIHGNIFAVCGSVSNEEYVKYIAKTEYGLQIQSLRLDLHDVYFIESDDCEPHLEKVSQIKSEDCKCFFCDDLLDMKYIFYLPSGSVVHDYNVDLE